MLLASPVALGASDVFSNVGPASQVSGLSTEFPLGDYALDSHFSAISVGLFSGVDVSGVPPMIAYFLANTLWQLTAFLANTLITLFTFAFSLDLVNGSSATGGAGALAPVSSAIHTIYTTVFGAPWLTVAVVLAGMWAMWKALVQRRYVETAGALALSLIYVIVALAFVTQPQATIGSASRWTNEMSTAFLSLTSQGNLSSQQQAKQADADQLFDVLVYQPWVVLEFGGIEHCVTTGTNNSVAVQPLTAQQSQALANGTEVQIGDRTCINNSNKYASHFLRYSPDDNDRTSEYTALEKGDTGDLPTSDPSKASGSYQLGKADEPAADAMGKGGQYQRLLLAIVIFVGECGAFLLLGVLSVAVILAQVILLLLLAFAPVALVIAVFPGRGHEFFLGWLTRLATFLLRKAVYSLILAVLLAVAAALDSASADLGWLMSFGLEATFFWAVFLYRHQLTSRLSLATTGHGGTEDQALRLATLYALTRNLRYSGRRSSPPPPPGGDSGNAGGQGGRGDSDPPTPRTGGTPEPPASTDNAPTAETTAPASAGSATTSTTRGDTPVTYTPASEIVNDQHAAHSTTTGAEAAPEPTAPPQHHAAEADGARRQELSETRPSTHVDGHQPSPQSSAATRGDDSTGANLTPPSSTAATPSDESTGTSSTPPQPSSTPVADRAAHVTPASSAPAEVGRRETDTAKPAGSSASTAETEPGGKQQGPAASPLAESVRHDLRRAAPLADPTPDPTQAPSATQTSPAPPSRRPERPTDTRVEPAARPPADRPRSVDEREGR